MKEKQEIFLVNRKGDLYSFTNLRKLYRHLTADSAESVDDSPRGCVRGKSIFTVKSNERKVSTVDPA